MNFPGQAIPGSMQALSSGIGFDSEDRGDLAGLESLPCCKAQNLLILRSQALEPIEHCLKFVANHDLVNDPHWSSPGGHAFLVPTFDREPTALIGRGKERNAVEPRKGVVTFWCVGELAPRNAKYLRGDILRQGGCKPARAVSVDIRFETPKHLIECGFRRHTFLPWPLST